MIEELIAEAESLKLCQSFCGYPKQDHRDGEMPENGITLSTIHSVKGLNFSVFVAGWKSDSPHYKSDSESERRLAYVAMTRAKDYLYLLSVAQRDLRDSDHDAPQPVSV